MKQNKRKPNEMPAMDDNGQEQQEQLDGQMSMDNMTEQQNDNNGIQVSRMPEPVEDKFLEKLPLGKAVEMITRNVDGGGTAGGEMTPRQTVIGEKELSKGAEILNEYKTARSTFEQRIVDDELWWKLRHWDAIRKGRQNEDFIRPSSAWLFNAIINKHADAMDNIPEAIVLPREQSDELSAKTLSAILPAVMEAADFEDTYSQCWDDKLKHGTGIYGVFWNSSKENGLGDVDIKQLDILKVFWEPAITDIQKSRNLFITELIDTDLLEQQYPQHKGKLSGNVIDVKEYVYDDTVNTDNKSLVVDWYYKKRDQNGREILHYVKFVGNVLLFASENEAGYEDGWYAHGKYPVVFDNLYREKGSPAGFGIVSICKDPQLYIDSLSGNILETSMMGSKRRYFASDSLNVNKEQFKNWKEPIVDVTGSIDDNRLKEIKIDDLSPVYVNVMEQKIEEMKDTVSNRDINSGSAGAGVTAAAAISALQEAGNKTSRDIINTSYRSFKKVCEICIELMRQFYDESRCFRIVGEKGKAEYMEFSNAMIKAQQMGIDADGQPLIRQPVFDLKIKAQKKSAFSRLEQNELAKELYGLGFFNPERATEVMPALDMMDFEGIDKVRDKVKEGDTLFKICQQQQQQIQQLMQMVQMSMAQQAPPANAPEGGSKGGKGGKTPAKKGNRGDTSEQVMGSSSDKTPFMQRTAAGAVPQAEGI